jgi:hypothetical protein
MSKLQKLSRQIHWAISHRIQDLNHCELGELKLSLGTQILMQQQHDINEKLKAAIKLDYEKQKQEILANRKKLKGELL